MPHGSATTQAHLWFLGLQTKCSPNTVSTTHSPCEGTVFFTKMKPVKDISKQCEKSSLQAKSNLPTEYQAEIFSHSSWGATTQGYIHVWVFSLVSSVLIHLAQWKRSITPTLKSSAEVKQGKFMGFGKRDWQNRSTGLGRDEDMMCGTGGIWEWKLWERLFALEDTSPLFGSLLWDRKHFYNTTMSLHELCLCYPKKKARHWPMTLEAAVLG